MSDDPEFVDTNVLLYAFDLTAGSKREAGMELLTRLATSRRGCLSVQVLQELYVNATRKLERPMDPGEASARISELGAWRVHRPGVTDVLAAIDLHRRHTISFWDAMIVRSAAELGCATIWSEDLNPGQVYNGVRVVDPFI